MKTSELINYVASDLLSDRTEIVSGDADELWSSAFIGRQLAEAERLMCRKAWVLEDSGNTAATRIQLVQDKGEYALHKSVLFVKAVRLSDTDVDLPRAGYNDNRVYSLTTAFDDFFDVNTTYIENSGRPSRYSTDMGNKFIRVRQKPNADAALLKLNLVVVRLPLAEISSKEPDVSPEIPEELHMDLALYAAGRCLSLPSVESELRSLGKSYLKEFEDKIVDAKHDRQQLTQSAPRHRFGAWASDSGV